MWPAGAATPERLSGCVRRGWRWPQKPKYGYVELQRGPAPPGVQRVQHRAERPKRGRLVGHHPVQLGPQTSDGPAATSDNSSTGCARLLC